MHAAPISAREDLHGAWPLRAARGGGHRRREEDPVGLLGSQVSTKSARSSQKPLYSFGLQSSDVLILVLVLNSFLFLVVRLLLLEAMHLFLVAYCF